MSVALYHDYLEKHKRRQNRGALGKDSEQSKCYKAEWAVDRICKDKIKKIESIEEAEKIKKRILKSKTWEKVCLESGRMSSKKFVSVSAKKKNSGRGFAGMAFQDGTIVLDLKTGLDYFTLCHELAHVAGNPHHGRTFRNANIALVSRFIGRDVAKELKAQYRKQKLRIGDARKPLTYEQWMDKRERALEMLHEKKGY